MGIFIKGKQRGQTLIEALVALGAASLVVSAITVTVITALNNVQYTKNQNLAGQYAQQALEAMRQLSLSNWTLFSSYSGKYCMDGGTTSLRTPDPASGDCGLNYGTFKREVSITQNSTSCSNATLTTAVVSWGDSKCPSTNLYCHNVTLSSCYTNVNGNIFSTP